MGLLNTLDHNKPQPESPLIDGSRSAANTSSIVPHHPLHVKPSGNLYTACFNIKDQAGRLSLLPDELLVQILEALDSLSLRNVGQTCKALYAFARLDDIWKNLFILSTPPSFSWQGTWRSSYLGIPKLYQSRINCSGLFSDVLHRPFLCAYVPLEPYVRDIPAKNTIPRVSNLSHDDFANDWVNSPFILTEPVTKWPVFMDWSAETLLKKFRDIKFRAEAVDWPLHTYVDYMNDSSDESPLYLFDRSFVEKMGIQVGEREGDGEYWTPECFGEDLFSVLGDERPDSRWLIVGPARSGSTFHKDPNATSAWNAVLSGSKYWIMFPTSPSFPPPPGVSVSKDHSEVTSPLSIAEWLLGFHAEARKTTGCLEGICNAGEVLHVPSGWWHLVVNLEATIAITQNFVPKAHLGSALSFLKFKANQVSGFKKSSISPYDFFVERLGHRDPELLDKALSEINRSKDTKKRKWNELVHDIDEVTSERADKGFGFDFGDDDDADVP